MADTWIGLDLGRMVDYSALAVIRRSLIITEAGLPLRDHRNNLLYRFEVPQLKQYQRGTPYPEVISHIRDRVLTQAWLDPKPFLVVDAGGVGGGIVDMLIDAKLPATIVALTITGGMAVTTHRWPRSKVVHWHVAKQELVSVTNAASQTDRIIVYPMPLDRNTGQDHAATLKKELRGFTVRQTRAANEIYSHREGEHDDILLATAMPVFLGQRKEYGYGFTPHAAARPLTRDQAAVEDGIAAETAAMLADRRSQDDRRFAECQARDKERQSNPFDPSWNWNLL